MLLEILTCVLLCFIRHAGIYQWNGQRQGRTEGPTTYYGGQLCNRRARASSAPRQCVQVVFRQYRLPEALLRRAPWPLERCVGL